MDDKDRDDLESIPEPGRRSQVRFVATIPKRMHPELTHYFAPSGDAERFEIRTVYGKWGPVTFIRPLGGTGTEDNPSSLVVLVREFLERELERVNAPVRVITTGPSPFHADMEIRPSTDMAAEFEHDWQKTDYGYDRVNFFYDPEEASPDAAYRAITEAITDPFSKYYFLIRARNVRMARSWAVIEMSNRLVAVHRRTGIRGYLYKTTRSGTLARELLLETITAKQSESEDRAFLREYLLDRDPTLVLPALAAICEKEVEASDADQLSTAQEVARTLEGGRVSQYEVLMLSASTLFGAMGGVIAALIAG